MGARLIRAHEDGGKQIAPQLTSTVIDMLLAQPWKPREDERPGGSCRYRPTN